MCERQQRAGARRRLGGSAYKINSRLEHLGARWHSSPNGNITLPATWVNLEAYGNLTGKWAGREKGSYGQVCVAVDIITDVKAVLVKDRAEDVSTTEETGDENMALHTYRV